MTCGLLHVLIFLTVTMQLAVDGHLSDGHHSNELTIQVLTNQCVSVIKSQPVNAMERMNTAANSRRLIMGNSFVPGP